MQLFSSSKNKSTHKSSMRNRRSPWQTFRPRLELLENRLAPAILTVNTLTDETTADNFLSLREAIGVVNSGSTSALSNAELAQISGPLGQNDTIQFDPSLSGTSTLTSGELLISQNVTIVGPSANQLAVSGNAASRVFEIGSGVTVSISGLTIENGYSSGPGGAISNAGTLTVSDSTFFQNDHFPPSFASLSTVIVGGAIYNAGRMVINNSMLAENGSEVFIQYTYGNGGAIYNNGSMTVSNSTFTNNVVADRGGAIFNNSLVTVSNSTFADNTVFTDFFGIQSGAAHGGGIFNNGTASVSNSTFTGNTAFGGYYGGHGGAIENYGTLTMANTIVAGNIGLQRGGGIWNQYVSDVAGAVLSNGYNLIGDASGSAGFGAIGDQAGTDTLPINPYLGPLAKNGGPTQTFAILQAGQRAMANGGPTTTLTEPIDATSATIKVNNAAAIASTPGSYPILIESEQILVTDVDLTNNTLTVQRGYNGTTPAGHSSGAAIYPATDQRGLPRVVNGKVDIGAYQSQTVEGSTIAVSAPSPAANTPAGLPAPINLGSFTDTNSTAGPWLVTVSWGDGTSDPAFLTSTQGSLGNLTHLYAAGGTYPVTITVSDVNGQANQAVFAVQTHSITSADLQAYLTTAHAVTIPASAANTPATVIQAVNGLTNITQSVNITLDLGGGIYSTSGTAYNPSDPSTGQNVTFVVQNGTLESTGLTVGSGNVIIQNCTVDSSLGALTVASGNVIVQNCTVDSSLAALSVSSGKVLVNTCTLITSGDAPTVQLSGGALTMRNDIIQESTGYSDAALSITGGTVDLGTLVDPGNNLINVNGTGQFLQNTTANVLAPFGDTFEVNGAAPPPIPLAINVTNTNDSGPGSLRQAIIDALVQGILQTGQPELNLNFAIPTTDPGYNATMGTYTITLTSGALVIVVDTAIVGPGAGKMAVNGNHASGVFQIVGGVNASMSGLTIENGNADSGGGISNGGSLTLSNCTLSGNSAVRGGGGISNGGSLTLTNCTLSGNSAAGSGGGIDNYALTTVGDSMFTGNSAGYEGGGIANDNFGSLTVSNSTFSHNSAAVNGGGISSDDQQATDNNPQGDYLVVGNSTFYGNAAGNLGGGIFFSAGLDQLINGDGYPPSRPSVLTNVTMADNRSIGSAGGIYADPYSYFILILDNSIVVDNFNGPSPSMTADDIGGAVTGAYNLIGTGGSAGLQDRSVDPVDGNQVGVANPGLAPLGDYGGPTQTMALLPGSPAIDAGSNDLAVDANGNPLTTDQRGFARVVNSTVDIGAFEFQPSEFSRNYLETVVSGTLPVDPTTGHPTVAFALNTQDLANAFMQIFSSTNLTPLTAPAGATTPIDISVSLGSGVSVTEADLSIPTGFRVSINGGTWYGGSPALTLDSGSLTVTNAAFQNATDAPTILVRGGSLTLRQDVVQESTGYTDAAIAVTGGSVDLGTTASPGNNTININGMGQLVQNSTTNAISAVGNSFEAGGTILTAANLTFTALSTSLASSILNQAITLTATVRGNGAGTPAGSVDFLDTTGNTDLGSVVLSGGTASLKTSKLTVGSHLILASYSGNSSFLPSIASLTETVRYNFSGFLAPLNQNMAFGLNRTIPIKFQLSDFNGSFISSLSAVVSLQVLNGQGANILTATGNTMLRYDSTANQFVYNWNTKGLAAGGYAITLNLSDGTTKTKVIQLSANGAGGSTQMALGSDGGDNSGLADTLLAGDLNVYISDPNGYFTVDDLARIQDTINGLDTLLASYGVTITEVGDSASANLVLDTAFTSACGGLPDGVLGCFNGPAGEITILQGWTWYAGADPTQIGASQYDFQSTVTHEFGHALGLGHATDPNSPMYETLALGQVHRTMTVADLNLIEPPQGPDPERSAPSPWDGVYLFSGGQLAQLPMVSGYQDQADAPSTKQAALNAVLADWTTTTDFAGHVTHILDDGTSKSPFAPSRSQAGAWERGVEDDFWSSIAGCAELEKIIRLSADLAQP